MLSSQERHEQHLARERTRTPKMLRMKQTLSLSDSEVLDHVHFAQQVHGRPHCVRRRVHGRPHHSVRVGVHDTLHRIRTRSMCPLVHALHV